MAAVEYIFYTGTYHGDSIAAADWPRLEARAQAQLAAFKRRYTVRAPEENSEAMAICAMADTAFYMETVASEAAVSSVSVGSVHVSYGGAGKIDTSSAGQEREAYNAARLYLDFYLGVK